MFERYSTDKLFVATIHNMFLKSRNPNGYYRMKRKGILYDNEGTLIDIMRPEQDLNDNSIEHHISISDVTPLYPEGVHKVVSKRQAYKRYIIKKRKLTK